MPAIRSKKRDFIEEALHSTRSSVLLDHVLSRLKEIRLEKLDGCGIAVFIMALPHNAVAALTDALI
jgi:hypothetical protein